MASSFWLYVLLHQPFLIRPLELTLVDGRFIFAELGAWCWGLGAMHGVYRHSESLAFAAMS